MSISESNLSTRLDKLEKILRADYEFEGDFAEIWKETEKEFIGLRAGGQGIAFFTNVFSNYGYLNMNNKALECLIIQMVEMVRDRLLPIVFKEPTEGFWPGKAFVTITPEEMAPIQKVFCDIVADAFKTVFPNMDKIPREAVHLAYKQAVNVKLAYGIHNYYTDDIIQMLHW